MNSAPPADVNALLLLLLTLKTLVKSVRLRALLPAKGETASFKPATLPVIVQSVTIILTATRLLARRWG